MNKKQKNRDERHVIYNDNLTKMIIMKKKYKVGDYKNIFYSLVVDF